MCFIDQTQAAGMASLRNCGSFYKYGANSFDGVSALPLLLHMRGQFYFSVFSLFYFILLFPKVHVFTWNDCDRRIKISSHDGSLLNF